MLYLYYDVGKFILIDCSKHLVLVVDQLEDDLRQQVEEREYCAADERGHQNRPLRNAFQTI